LSKFKANGKSNLKWVYEFSSIESDEKKGLTAIRADNYTMHQIFHMNGLRMADLGERYEVVFHALLKDAAEFHGYAQTSIDHEVPELRRWWYTFVDQQVLHSHKEKTSFSQSVDGATVKAALTTLNPVDSVAIKIENPNKHQLQQHITVLRSAKSAVDKMVSQAEDLLFDVIAKEGAAPKGTLTEQLDTAMNGLKLFVKELTLFIQRCSGMEDEPLCAKELADAVRFIKDGTMHQDGFKEMTKRIRNSLK
jgi:hypothetical protein